MTQPDETPPAAEAPWGDDENFDAEKAKKLIANLRSENTKLKNREVLTDEHKAGLAELAKIKADSQSELEKVQSEVSRWQADAETWRKAAVGSKVQALAAESFADPTDAVAALADKNFLDAGGQIDESAIKTELASVLQAKPHWAKPTDATPRPPAPNPAQGAPPSGTSDPSQQFAATLQAAMATGQ